MGNSPTFLDHARDLLSLDGPVEVRRMFGGHGVYVAGAMFALLYDDELFLKTDAETRPRFVEAGCRAWRYERRDGTVTDTSYFSPPDGAQEDAEAMLPWARLALDAALRARAAKGAPRRPRSVKGARKPARGGADVRRKASAAAPRAARRRGRRAR